MYFYQDIITSAPTIDIEVFNIPDEGLFMATASFDSRNMKKTQSAIFKWDNGAFKLYQSLYTYGAQAFEHFQIDKQVTTDLGLELNISCIIFCNF